MARDALRYDISEAWVRIKDLPIPELTKLTKSKVAPAIEVAMCSALLTAIESGDMTVVFRFAERILGKPRQAVTVKTNNIDVTKLTDEQLQRIVAGEDPEEVVLSGVFAGVE